MCAHSLPCMHQLHKKPYTITFFCTVYLHVSTWNTPQKKEYLHDMYRMDSRNCLGVLKQKTTETGYAALLFFRGPEICLHRLILHHLRSSKQWHTPCWDPLWAAFISALAVSVQLGDRNVSDSGAVQWESCLQPVKTPDRHIWSHLEPLSLEISPSLSTYAQRLSSLEVRRIHTDSCSPTFFVLRVPPLAYQLALKG